LAPDAPAGQRPRRSRIRRCSCAAGR
jgi:hypothetical protein